MGRFVAVGFVVCWIGWASIAATGDEPAMAAKPRPGNLFGGERLIDPPMQKAPWSNPAAEEKNPKTTDSIRLLREWGFPDARGCEYREIDVTVGAGRVRTKRGDPSSQTELPTGYLTTTHGWIVRGESGYDPMCVIGWDGLVYPVVNVGPKADLKADVEAALATENLVDSDFFDREIREGRAPNAYSWTGLSHQRVRTTLLATLLILGENELAEQVWKPALKRHSPEYNALGKYGVGVSLWHTDPLPAMAIEWGDALCWRVPAAHQRGDFTMAAQDATTAAALRQRIQRAARPRGFETYAEQSPEFLPQAFGIEEFAQDAARRAEEARRGLRPKRVWEGALDDVATAEERLALLKRDLTEHGASPWDLGQFHGGEPKRSGFVEAYEREGAAGRAALVDLLENDERFARGLAPVAMVAAEIAFEIEQGVAVPTVGSVGGVGVRDPIGWADYRRLLIARVRKRFGLPPAEPKEIKPREWAFSKSLAGRATPRQLDDWTPPEQELPNDLARAVAALRRLGYPDPRDCEYRDVWIPLESKPNRDGSQIGLVATKLPGWVLPPPTGALDEAPRFAMLWSGIIAPVVKMGAERSLKEDIEASYQAPNAQLERAAADDFALRSPARAPSLYGLDIELERKLALHPVHGRVAPLLLLGETEAAIETWRRAGELPQHDWGHHRSVRNSFLVLAGDWEQRLANQLRRAIADRDFATAVDVARRLKFVHERFVREAEGLGLQRSDERWEATNRAAIRDADAKRVVELERFLNAPQTTRVWDVPRERRGDASARVAMLIRDLEQVTDGYWGEKTRRQWFLKEFQADAEVALPALLQCVAGDTRWTLRDLSPQYAPYYPGVAGVATDILAHWFETSEFNEDAYLRTLREGRFGEQMLFVDRLTLFIAEHRGTKPVDRLYNELASDDSSKWLDAAIRLASWSPGTIEANRRALADRRPSVFELLESHSDRLMVVEDEARRLRTVSSGWTNSFEIADAAFLWAPEKCGALAMRRAQDAAACYRRAVKLNVGNRRDLEDRWLSHWKLCLDAAMRAETPGAGASYVELLNALVDHRGRTVGGSHWDVESKPIIASDGDLDLFARYGDQDEIAAAGNKILTAPDSPWAKLLPEPEFCSSRFGPHRLVAIPAVREQMLKRLSQVDGPTMTIEIVDRAQHHNVTDRGGYTSCGEAYETDHDPLYRPNYSGTVRPCDIAATIYSRLIGAPRFRPYWPEAKRDQAIAALADHLKRWGGRYRTIVKPHQSLADSDETRPCFPRYTKPATKADLAAGRAIFSLEGQGYKRVVVPPLEHFPWPARWASDAQTVQPDPSTPAHLRPKLGDGLVWQVEDGLKDGVWTRHYGFVGDHIITEAAEREIELLEPSDESKSRR